VVGHKNPDTDSICSAIAYAYFRNKRVELGQLKGEAVPARQGELNPETKFVLEKFGFEPPELITDGTGKKVILVDHSEKAQSLDNIEKAEIIAIIDHHKIGDITTPNPIVFIAMPCGCTASIIKGLFEMYNIEIPPKIAGIMLASILSDTICFKSVTTTKKDIEAAKDLAKIAGIEDIEAFAMEMFKAKSDVAGKTPRELIFRDFKEFNMAGNVVAISQLELVSLDLVKDIKDSLYEEMKKIKEEKNYHSFLLMLTDIMKEGTELLVLTDNPKIIEKAFNKEVRERSIWLEGVMSRKKQVVPPLEKAFFGE